MEVLIMIMTAVGTCMFGFVIAAFLDHYVDEGERGRSQRPFEKRKSGENNHKKTVFR